MRIKNALITHSVLWKNGSGGFGFGVWRVNYSTSIFWTIAIGPLNIYIIISNTSGS